MVNLFYRLGRPYNPRARPPSITHRLGTSNIISLRRRPKTMVNGSRARGKLALILIVFAALSFTVSTARTAQAPSAASDIPKTAPGEQFSAWLTAFNSGDKSELEKFRSHFDKPEDHKVEGMLGFRQQTGGFDLRKIEDSTGTQLTALVQERDSDQFARLKIEVETAAPNKITHLDVRAI